MHAESVCQFKRQHAPKAHVRLPHRVMHRALQLCGGMHASQCGGTHVEAVAAREARVCQCYAVACMQREAPEARVCQCEAQHVA